MRISDWSSDVCSSDLAEQAQCAGGDEIEADMTEPAVVSERLGDHRCEPAADDAAQIERHRGAGIAHARREQARQPAAERAVRSEERRVGKQGGRTYRSWWAPYH